MLLDEQGNLKTEQEELKETQKASNIGLLNALSTYYNRTQAVNYAYNWVNKRNSNYNFYIGMNNCTNFISQALEAGFMTYIVNGTLGKYDNKNWYYVNTSNAEPSWTWGGANNLKKHLGAQPIRYQLVTSYSDLSIGDIIQADWTNDNSVDHSMIITKKTGNTSSTIYLTYSNSYNDITSDKKDRKLSDIMLGNTNAKYYLWKIIY